MADGVQVQTANEQLAAIIAEALHEAGLILATRVDEVRQQLAVGSLKEGDWRILIEEGLLEPGAEVTDGQGD